MLLLATLSRVLGLFFGKGGFNVRIHTSSEVID